MLRSALLATLILLGCAHRPPQPLSRPEPCALLVVVNDHWSPVTVFLEQHTQRLRIGDVPGTSRRAFTLTRCEPNEQVRLIARANAEREMYVGPYFQIPLHSRIVFDVRFELPSSDFGVWRADASEPSYGDSVARTSERRSE